MPYALPLLLLLLLLLLLPLPPLLPPPPSLLLPALPISSQPVASETREAARAAVVAFDLAAVVPATTVTLRASKRV
jgi:hypothetical protein